MLMFANYARRFVLSLSGLLLTACLSVPVTSMPRLAGLDPVTMDAVGVEVAVRAPDDYDLPEDGAILVLSVWREDGDEGREERFELVPVSGAPSEFLQDRNKQGFTIHRLHVDRADAPRMADFRAYMLSLKELPGQKGLSMNVTTRPCLKAGANPFKDPRVEIYLRPTQDEDYFTLIKERKVPITWPNGEARYCVAS